jgi:molybdopterin-guanine dinucleotide biosynthesis protein A
MTLAGFVLAGGASARMGRDKALLLHRGKPLVVHIADQVRAAVGNVAIIGPPERYAFPAVPVIPDREPGLGPLGGLRTAFENTGAPLLLVVACDMPALTADALSSLILEAIRSGNPITAAAGPHGEPEPLCAVYHRREVEPLVCEMLAAGERKAKKLLARVPLTLWIPEEPGWLANLNTREEWQNFQDHGR